MTKRRILSSLAFLLLAALVNCQFEDDALSENSYPSADLDDGLDYSIEDDDDEEEEEEQVDAKKKQEKDDVGEVQPDYVDNRIDTVPTFVSPVEKFIKVILKPLGWISHATGDSKQTGTSKPRSSVGKFISEFAHPIKNFVVPAERAIKGGFGEVLNLIGDRFKAIFPGTEWCGAGNIAKNSEELGLFKKTDSCCRDHDQCSTNLDAGATEFGLQNNGIFTRSHCQCDANFYHCLKQARSLVATNIGLTYFNILRPQCFKEEYPAHCVRYGRTRLRNNKCLDYDYDHSQNKTWQWFDSPDFL